jgi:hypothetical protein
MSLLGEHLGPILFQLPPRWYFNPDRVEQFLGALSKDFRYAFDLLARHRAAFCIYELDGFLTSNLDHIAGLAAGPVDGARRLVVDVGVGKDRGVVFHRLLGLCLELQAGGYLLLRDHGIFLVGMIVLPIGFSSPRSQFGFSFHLPESA